MTPEEKIANDVLIKDLQDTIKEQIIVYNDISREATDYRNENTELKSQVAKDKLYISMLEPQVTRLQEELKMEETVISGLVGTIAKLKEILQNQTIMQTSCQEYMIQYKSILDKIDKLFNSWLDGNTNLGNFCTEYKEIMAKHKDDK